MPAHKRIEGNINCPRCNAIAELRYDAQESREDRVFVHIVCPKCRLRQYVRTTTKKALRLERQAEILEKKLLENPSLRLKLIGRIETLRSKARRAEIGI